MSFEELSWPPTSRRQGTRPRTTLGVARIAGGAVWQLCVVAGPRERVAVIGAIVAVWRAGGAQIGNAYPCLTDARAIIAESAVLMDRALLLETRGVDGDVPDIVHARHRGSGTLDAWNLNRVALGIHIGAGGVALSNAGKHREGEHPHQPQHHAPGRALRDTQKPLRQSLQNGQQIVAQRQRSS